MAKVHGEDGGQSSLAMGVANQTYGVWGDSQTGLGVIGTSDFQIGVEGRSQDGDGVFGRTAHGFGVHGVTEGWGNPEGPSPYSAGVYGSTDLSGSFGVLGQARFEGTGVAGFADDIGVSGSGKIGVLGDGSLAGQTGIVGKGDNVGVAAFNANNSNAAYLAGQSTAAWFTGLVYVEGDFIVDGLHKSVVVQHPDGSHRRLYCMESPESWFEDFGIGQLHEVY